MTAPVPDRDDSPPALLSSIPDTSTEGLKRRLERISRIVGSVNALAKTASVPQSTIRKYFIKGEAPSTAIIALAKAAGVRPEWLLTGSEPLWLEAPNIDDEMVATDDVAFIPLYHARGKATPGANLKSFAELVDHLPFKRSWLRRYLDAASESLASLFVDGDSMEPVLRSDDMILIDLTDLSVREGLYALIRGQEFLVKRLQTAASGQIKIVSANKSYKPLLVPASEIGDQMSIVGRVVWTSRRVS